MEPTTHWAAASPQSDADSPLGIGTSPESDPSPLAPSASMPPSGYAPAAEQLDPAELGREKPPARRGHARGLRGRLSAALAAIVAFLAKFKAILLLLPKIKLLATVGTMAVSIAAYAALWGWRFGVGVVLLLFVHEIGHVIQLRREGVRASAPMFIPFMGAVISARSLGQDALAEARVGLAGPILGSIGAVACVGVWHGTGNDLFRALAYFGFLINLFNLLPVVPLDGGRAMAAMAPWMWFIGFAALVPLVFVFTSPLLLLIVAFAGYETYNRWRRLRSGSAVDQSYYRVRPLDRVLVAAVYVTLIGLLVAGMHGTFLHRSLS